MFLRETNGFGKFEVNYCNGYDASPHIARTICCDPERWKMVVDFWVGILYFRSFDMGQPQIFIHLAVDHGRVTIV